MIHFTRHAMHVNILFICLLYQVYCVYRWTRLWCLPRLWNISRGVRLAESSAEILARPWFCTWMATRPSYPDHHPAPIIAMHEQFMPWMLAFIIMQDVYDMCGMRGWHLVLDVMDHDMLDTCAGCVWRSWWCFIFLWSNDVHNEKNAIRIPPKIEATARKW